MKAAAAMPERPARKRAETVVRTEALPGGLGTGTGDVPGTGDAPGVGEGLGDDVAPGGGAVTQPWLSQLGSLRQISVRYRKIMIDPHSSGWSRSKSGRKSQIKIK